MIDVNISTDVKVVGVPQAAAVERRDRDKPQVAPVADSGGSSGAAVDDKVLHGRSPSRPVSEEEVKKSLEMIEKRLSEMSTKLSFTLSKNPEAVVVQVKDTNSGEVIRQIPSEEVLALRKKLDELAGLLFDTKA